ncbi:MAG TPA: glycosyltransferase [Acetobacteraceae bacterium]|nr:glycosyltransferase [Acetobacteraceae bacterium]
MRFVLFTHSLISCWNHGNAHFLRGVLRELLAQGHQVRSFEPEDGWSRTNLVSAQGAAAASGFATRFPELVPHVRFVQPDLDAMLDGADVVLVHEWTDPALVAAIGRRRAEGGRFALLFHDTHHRAVSDPDAIFRLDLSGYDAVLAFGDALADVYRRSGWGDRVFTWHEAADTRLFRPPEVETQREGVVFIGNWGDDERGEELRSFLLHPAAALHLPLDVYGVRYPDAALLELAAGGGHHRGWVANACVPSVFARHAMTVHVPRRFYAEQLPGIPTIRVFEALACGIPLICAPWTDSEALFRPGEDYLVANSPTEMQDHMRALTADGGLRRSLAEHGRETILARHTCAHRVAALMGILQRLQVAERKEAA